MTKNASPDFRLAKYACYSNYISMSAIFTLPPILFLTFHDLYGISYSLLGTLVLVNFCTQLIIDLVFSFFPKYFNIKLMARLDPLITALGLALYAVIPTFFPQYAYAGLIIGTVIFAVASGLSEVLISPIVAAIPSDNPGRDMSRLHSTYAYGVVGVVVISTLFLRIFGNENWMYLILFWAIVPIVTCVLFCRATIPDLVIDSGGRKGGDPRKNFGFILCVLCIFFGGAAENTMTSWISGFAESALKISKTVGDILGMALFAVAMALGRSFYAKFGKNISKVLLAGMTGSIVCYLVAGLSNIPAVSLVACVLEGFCASMLWPGTLILMEEKYPGLGVAAYALMAAGGDLGGSLAPQLLGVVVDVVSGSGIAEQIGQSLSLTAEQVGMKAGMLSAALFPILGTVVILMIKRGARSAVKNNG